MSGAANRFPNFQYKILLIRSRPVLFKSRKHEVSGHCTTMQRPTLYSSRVSLMRMTADYANVSPPVEVKRAKTSTERQRDYRARKRAAQAELRRLNGEAESKKEKSTGKRRPRTAKERQDAFRARRKAAAGSSSEELPKKSSNTADTTADEVKEEPRSEEQKPPATDSSVEIPTVIEVIRKLPARRPKPVTVNPTQPKGPYSLLKKNYPEVVKTTELKLRAPADPKPKTAPIILRRSPATKIILLREHDGKATISFPESAGGSRLDPRNIVTKVQCASTSNEASRTELNGKVAKVIRSTNQVRCRTILRFPSQQDLFTGVTEEVRTQTGDSTVPTSSSKEPAFKKIILRRSVPLFDNPRGGVSAVVSTAGMAPQERALPGNPPSTGEGSMSTRPDTGPPQPVRTLDAPAPVKSIDVSFIKTEAPEEFIVDTFDPSSDSTQSATSDFESAMQADFAEEPYFIGYPDPDSVSSAATMDDLLDDISKNVGEDSDRFYMVSHESLMEALSTCNICASAADVTLKRKGTTCEASIKCRSTEQHDFFWDGEKRGHPKGRNNGGQACNMLDSRTIRPRHDIPWSLLMMCLIAKIVDIPMKQLERFCRLLFVTDNIGAKLQAAASLTASFLMIHALTKPKLEKPIDHLKLIVICRKLLVFLDPFSYSPLACFEFRGGKLSSTSSLSSALNIGLQRLQLLNSSKFSRVDLIHSSSPAEEPDEWKPVLVPDMDLMYEEALTCIHIALWQNKYEFDMKSCRLRGILGDITKALCFFQPEAATMSEGEARSHYSLVLSDLSKIHDCRYVPRLGEIALLKGTFQFLSFDECRIEIEALIAEINRIDVYSILNPLYEKTISTADASYVVSIQNEGPCRATHKVMNMIEMCQDEELTLETALRVLMLLPARNSPSDVIGNVFGYL